MALKVCHQPAKCFACNASQNDFVSDFTTATTICSNCGCIQVKKFSNPTSDSDQYFSQIPSHCGLPIDQLLPRSSLSTKIKYSGSKYISLVRLHRWNVIDPQERSLFAVFKFMDSILTGLPVTPATKLQAKRYYKVLSSNDPKTDRKLRGTLTRGSIRRAFIATCIYVSCQNHDTPVQKTKIAQLCKVSKPDLTKGLKKFSVLEKNKNLQFKKPQNYASNVHNLLKQFCLQLRYTRQFEDIAHILYDRLPQLELLQNTNQISVCAGLLFFVSTLFTKNHSQRARILETVNTSVVTLQKVFKVLLTQQHVLLIGLHKYIQPSSQ